MAERGRERDRWSVPWGGHHLLREVGGGAREGEERLCMSAWVLCSPRLSRHCLAAGHDTGQRVKGLWVLRMKFQESQSWPNASFPRLESCFQLCILNAFGAICTEHCSKCFRMLTHSLFQTALNGRHRALLSYGTRIWVQAAWLPSVSQTASSTSFQREQTGKKCTRTKGRFQR